MKSERKSNLLILILAVVCISLIIAVFLTIVKGRQEKEQPQARRESTSAASESTDTVTYEGVRYRKNPAIRTMLFMGIDKDADVEVGGVPGTFGQSDSLNLLIMNEETKEASVLQISRDSMVNVEIYNAEGTSKLTTQQAQICLQYAYGDGAERSCKMVSDRVEELLMGVEVDSYLSLTLDGMIAATEAIGGVTLTVPEDYTAVDPAFAKGATVTLEGEMAEKYVRTRDIGVLDSNNQRMDRQAQFMAALIDKMQKIEGKTRYAMLYQQLEPYMTTNMTADEMLETAGYDVKTEMQRIPGTIIEKDGHAQYHVDNKELYKLLISLFYEKE